MGLCQPSPIDQWHLHRFGGFRSPALAQPCMWLTRRPHNNERHARDASSTASKLAMRANHFCWTPRHRSCRLIVLITAQYSVDNRATYLVPHSHRPLRIFFSAGEQSWRFFHTGSGRRTAPYRAVPCRIRCEATFKPAAAAAGNYPT